MGNLLCKTKEDADLECLSPEILVPSLDSTSSSSFGARSSLWNSFDVVCGLSQGLSYYCFGVSTAR